MKLKMILGLILVATVAHAQYVLPFPSRPALPVFSAPAVSRPAPRVPTAPVLNPPYLGQPYRAPTLPTQTRPVYGNFMGFAVHLNLGSGAYCSGNAGKYSRTAIYAWVPGGEGLKSSGTQFLIGAWRNKTQQLQTAPGWTES